MRGRHLRMLAVVGLVGVLAAGCGAPISDKYVIDEPYTLEAVDGTELWKVTLTEQAVRRLGIDTEQVSTSGEFLVVPSGALWLDTKGVFWVYTNPEPNVFLRHAVTVEDDDGAMALLSAGPAEGTTVVTVGVPELYGTEVGVGK